MMKYQPSGKMTLNRTEDQLYDDLDICGSIIWECKEFQYNY